MNDSISNNKRIAVNTLILYFKLIISIIVSFVVSRLVLEALGTSDYGLYNVVGGIVALLNILGTSMVATSYRYMAVELGKGEKGNPNRIYNTVFIIHAAFALLLILIGETIGIFYIQNYLNVDHSRIGDALFILHLSLLTTSFAIINIPMSGLIIARENFLFTSIVEISSALLKLCLIVLLMSMTGDKLRIYALFLALVQLVSPISYHIYCKKTEKDIVRWNFNKNIYEYSSIIKFSSLMMIGALACMARVQGAAIIINFYFGTILNAAFGLASQVDSAAAQFTTTLRQAAVPQIMKSQASGDEERSLNLVYYISKYSFLFILIPTIPLITCISGTLKIWLGVPPEYTDIFVILMLINGMIANLSAGFDATIQATGKVKKNQIGYSLINLALLPIIFFLYKIGLPPYVNVIVMIGLTIITLIFQCWIMTSLSSFNIKMYINKTIIPSLFSLVLSWLPLHYIAKLFDNSSLQTLINLVIAVLWTCISIYIAGTTKPEKQKIIHLINTKLLKYHK